MCILFNKFLDIFLIIIIIVKVLNISIKHLIEFSDEMTETQDQELQKMPKDSEEPSFDYIFKILIIGNSSVGKTSFLFRYSDDLFSSAFISTVGIDFKVKTVVREDKTIKLQIWVCFHTFSAFYYF